MTKTTQRAADVLKAMRQKCRNCSATQTIRAAALDDALRTIEAAEDADEAENTIREKIEARAGSMLSSAMIETGVYNAALEALKQARHVMGGKV